VEDASLLRFLVDMRGENTTSTQVKTACVGALPACLPSHALGLGGTGLHVCGVLTSLRPDGSHV
jgi:hypothetical protein